MSKFNKDKSDKIKKWREKTKGIPKGLYCYDWINGKCKHYKYMGVRTVKLTYNGKKYKEKIQAIKCTFTNYHDINDMIFEDQCKVCRFE